MPYSMDTKANEKNSMSPSEYLTVNEQLMYKLAALDAAVQGGFRRLDEKMDRFQTDLHEGQIRTNDRINELDKEFTQAITTKRERIDALVKAGEAEKKIYVDRIIALETWTQVAMAKVGVVIAVIGGGLALAGPMLRNALGIPG